MSRRGKGSGHHEIRGCEASRWIDLKGHECYRLYRTADRSAGHDCDLKQLRESGQATAAAQLPSKERSYFQVAQMMRARRLASATVALLCPRWRSHSKAHRRR